MADSSPEIITTGKRRRVSKRAWIITLVILVILLAGAGTGAYYWYQYQHTDHPAKLNANQQAELDLARTMAAQKPNDDLTQRSVDYAVIAGHYEQASYYHKALEYAQKAQKLVDDNNLSDGDIVLSYYEQISEIYQKLDNKPQARNYLQKQIDFVKSHTKSGDDSSAYVKELEKRKADIK